MGKSIPTYTFKQGRIEVVFFGDIHWGAEECHEEQVLKTVSYILKRKNTYCILTGDLGEMATRGQSGSQIMQQKIPPTLQVLQLKKMLKPLADAGKILGYLRDNHMQRAERDAMLDLNAILADDLNVPYLSVGGIVKLNVAGRLFRIAIQHGVDSNKNEFNALDQMMMIYPDCDLYALAHNHRLSARTVVTMHYDDSGEECGREHWQIRTGSYLKFAQYARERLYRPAVIGSPIAIFTAEGIDVDIRTLSLKHSKVRASE